jgi:hypothetical protein
MSAEVSSSLLTHSKRCCDVHTPSSSTDHTSRCCLVVDAARASFATGKPHTSNIHRSSDSERGNACHRESFSRSHDRETDLIRFQQANSFITTHHSPAKPTVVSTSKVIEFAISAYGLWIAVYYFQIFSMLFSPFRRKIHLLLLTSLSGSGIGRVDSLGER